MEASVLVKLLEDFKIKNVFCQITRKNGYFFNGYVKEIDKEFIVFDDRKIGITAIALDNINEVRKNREGTR